MGKPSKRTLHGPGTTSNKPPSTASAASHSGGTASASTAPGQAAMACSTPISTSAAHAAAGNRNGSSAPNMDSGVSTSVTHGTANRLATKPTTDTWPNSSKVSGARARVMVHCSPSSPRRPAPSRCAPAASRCCPAARTLGWGGGGSCTVSSWSRGSEPVAGAPRAASGGACAIRWPLGLLANNTPTATKLSQNPGCKSAHGSLTTTTQNASSHTCGQGQRKPPKRSAATVASMTQVRCAGMPQPENKA